MSGHHIFCLKTPEETDAIAEAVHLAARLSCPNGTEHPSAIAPIECKICVTCQQVRDMADIDCQVTDAGKWMNDPHVWRHMRDVVKWRPARNKARVWVLFNAEMLLPVSWAALAPTFENAPEWCRFIFVTSDTKGVPLCDVVQV